MPDRLDPDACPACHGRGTDRRRHGLDPLPCPSCAGSGTVDPDPRTAPPRHPGESPYDYARRLAGPPAPTFRAWDDPARTTRTVATWSPCPKCGEDTVTAASASLDGPTTRTHKDGRTCTWQPPEQP